MLRISQFVADLRKVEASKTICFCSNPKGLQLHRFKMRGAQLMQVEFEENVCRDQAGRLTVDAISVQEFDPKEYARTVGGLLENLSDPTIQHYELIFGGDRDALKYVGLREYGEWISVEFEQVVRRVDGGFSVQEIRGEEHVNDTFPYMKEVDPNDEHSLRSKWMKQLGLGE